MSIINYKKITDFMLEAGERLKTKAGSVTDIGVAKRYLTEEDLAIERGLKELVGEFGSDHVLYAEEENEVFLNSENLWVVDPISSTRSFIQGQPHYAIVVCYVKNHIPEFAAVYDPSVSELFTAEKGHGARLNGEPIFVSTGREKVIFRYSTEWKEMEVLEKSRAVLKEFDLIENFHSLAVNYASVACGRADGVVTLTKDSFPEFAGSLIICEAGGNFTNLAGQEIFRPTDRVFIGGNTLIYPEIFKRIIYAHKQ
ncbi:MAG TPA: inositol monophosphatase [Patescibacteria group bacterium]|nr:inositol monophosphatase [Patescibacteria group bacterium]